MRSLARYADTWSPEDLNPDNWPPVNTSELPPAKLERFRVRKRLLQAYLAGEEDVATLLDRAGTSRGELYRLLDRACGVNRDGNPVGYLACIPGIRLRPYVRTQRTRWGTAGLFQQFLSEHPELQTLLDELALGKRKLKITTARGRHFKQIWSVFRQACRDAGLDVDNDYPFSNADGGREAVRRHVCAVRQTDFVASARIEHGDHVGRLATATMSSDAGPVLRPYERVQLDGHRLDAIINVRIQDALGNDIDLPLSRIWLLVLIDMASRAVLGYSLSLAENYTADDVLECIGSAFEPWSPKDLDGTHAAYQNNAGLPSGVLDGCQWRCFDSLQMDNAFSHLSEWVQGSIIGAGALEVITNKPRSPRSDAIIERFMRTFESITLHQWPNTTGTGPEDPRRRSPEQAAARFQVSFADLELVTDLAIANYNACAHTALNGRSPLEYLDYRLARGQDLVRYCSAQTADGLKLFERDFPVVVNASLAQGHKPYIQFLHVRYSSDVLRQRLDLKGQRVIFRVNTRDIRYGHVFATSGECIAHVSADVRWIRTAHSIKMRRAIFKKIKQNKLRDDCHDPVASHLDDLARRAPVSRKDRNRLLAAQKLTMSDKEATDDIPASESLTTASTRSRCAQPGWVRLTKTVST